MASSAQISVSPPEPVTEADDAPAVGDAPEAEQMPPSIKRFHVSVTEPLPKNCIAEVATREEAAAYFNAKFTLGVSVDRLSIREE